MGISALLSAQILDSTATGRSVLTGANAASIQEILGLRFNGADGQVAIGDVDGNYNGTELSINDSENYIQANGEFRCSLIVANGTCYLGGNNAAQYPSVKIFTEYPRLQIGANSVDQLKSLEFYNDGAVSFELILDDGNSQAWINTFYSIDMRCPNSAAMRFGANNNSNSGLLYFYDGTSTTIQFAKNARDIEFLGSTGTKLGTATTQKIGFWNATPIVQPSTSVGSAVVVSGNGGTVKHDDTFDGWTLQKVVKALRNIGLLA
jgi:hypothetical protein